MFGGDPLLDALARVDTPRSGPDRGRLVTPVWVQRLEPDIAALPAAATPTTPKLRLVSSTEPASAASRDDVQVAG